jgi:hypothetical protein
MLLAGWLLSATVAHADDNKAQCDLGKGSYMTATVVKGPKFTSGKFLKGVELSHTHLKVKPDGSNDIYDVAIDNVFAQGYEKTVRKCRNRWRRSAPATSSRCAVSCTTMAAKASTGYTQLRRNPDTAKAERLYQNHRKRWQQR